MFQRLALPVQRELGGCWHLWVSSVEARDNKWSGWASDLVLRLCQIHSSSDLVTWSERFFFLNDCYTSVLVYYMFYRHTKLVKLSLIKNLLSVSILTGHIFPSVNELQGSLSWEERNVPNLYLSKCGAFGGGGGGGVSRFQFPSKLIFWNLLSVQSQFQVCLLVKWLQMAVSDVIPCHSCDYHRYADDTEISDSAPPSDFTSTQSNIQSCISGTLSWMQSNKLKLSTEKTEMMLVGSWVHISRK